jgi:hypothetical protein
MIPTPGRHQRVHAAAGPASSPQPGPPRAVAARWPGQASNAEWSLHRGLGRLAWRLLFARQPHHPPAGNARPQHQQHHPRCLPQQVVPHSKQRAGHRHRRAAHQQPDRVALLAPGFQVGSGHGSSSSQRGTVRRRRWPDHQVAPVAPNRRAAPPAPSTHGGVALGVDGAAATRVGQRSGRAIAKNAGGGPGVAAPPHGAVGGRLRPLGLEAPATPPGRPTPAAGDSAVTGPPGVAARIDLHASLPAGPLHPAGPADPSTGGLPPRPLRGQGSLRAHECSLGLRPPLDRSGAEAARRQPVARGGRGPEPTRRGKPAMTQQEEVMPPAS